MYVGTPNFDAALEHLARERDVIVVDSLKAGSTADENDSSIRRGLDSMRAIGERTGCSFVVLVHAKKTSGSPVDVDDREILRGSSAVFDAADAVLVSFYRKAEERFDVRQAKARHGRAVEPFSLRLVDVEGGVRVQAEDTPESNVDAKKVSKLEDIKRAVVDVVKANAGQLKSANDICGLTRGAGKDVKLLAIRQLTEEGRLVLVGGFYRVA